MQVTVKTKPNLQQSPHWDRLWVASGRRLPTLRRDCLVQFVRSFASPGSFVAATVSRDQKLAAGIPLVTEFRAGLPWKLSLPVNPWMKCGDLLVDRQNASTLVFDELAKNILACRGWLLDFQWVQESSDWEQLLAALQRRGCQVDRQRQFDVGMIETTGDWESYFAARSKSHRKNMKSQWRQLNQAGTVTFERHQRIDDPQRLESLMTEVLQLEHAGWKGDAGSSMQSDTKTEKFYRDIASLLNRCEMLEVQVLRLNGRPIAFEFGYVNDRTYFSHKVSYDPEFACYSPGQLLLYQQLQHWFAGDEVEMVDTMGIFNEATARWTRRTRPVMRFRVSRPGAMDRFVWQCLRSGRQKLGRIIGQR